MDWLQRAKRFYVIFSILLMALGLFFILYPMATLRTVCYLLGVLSILIGLVKIVGYFVRRDRLAFQFDLALGILSLVLGVLLCCHPGNLMVLLQFLMGLFILFESVFKFQTALDAKRCGFRRWWSIFLTALLSAAAGLLLLLNPFAGARALVILLGITLVVDGLQNLVVVLFTSRYIRHNLDEDDFDIVMDE